MQPNDFVWTQIYKGAISRGCKQGIAHKHAVTGSEKYRKNQFTGKAVNFIEDCIKAAVKESKMVK